MMMRRRRRRRKILYLYRHHFIDSMLGCSRRHNAVTGHFSFEQEATTFVPYFCCPPHYVVLYSTLYILYMSWYLMYYITIWTGSHTSAAHHNRSTYMPGISYKTFMLLTTLDHSTSVQIPEHTDKWQYTKVQSKIQLSTGTQIAKKDIPQTGVHTNCEGTYISFLQFLPLVALSWARCLFCLSMFQRQLKTETLAA